MTAAALGISPARSGDALSAYAALSLTPPSAAMVTVCHGFGCRLRTEVALTPADGARLAQLLKTGHGSPAAERQAIANAVAWFDKRVGRQAGTQHHIARAMLTNVSDPAAQFDCIDASRNTTTLLLLLDSMRLIKHHTVEEPESRGYFVDLRYPHATAVVTEKTSRVKWSIDSWTRGWGERPEIMPLARWLDQG